MSSNINKTPQTPLQGNGSIKSPFVKNNRPIELKNYLDDSSFTDSLYSKSKNKIHCNEQRCMGSFINPVNHKYVPKTKEELIEQAKDFIKQFYGSVKMDGSKNHLDRLDEIVNSINTTGSYELKEQELSFGAKTAWRNAPRCVGRIQWTKLQLFDSRLVINAKGMFDSICNHIRYAYNGGIIRSAITVFRQRTEPNNDFRIWNGQFFTYAGYENEDGSIIGDKAQIEFTKVCIKLGWKPKGEPTDFDILPLVLQANGQDPEWFNLPEDLIYEIELNHPTFKWFNDLKLKWYCVPAVASMRLDIGGLEFTACPFNGWYMSTEISRNLSESNRYNKLELIAEKMDLDTKNNSSLWKDKAIIELNLAVLSSFQKKNITISDHHSATESFMKHHENENHLRGGCPADWVWIVPPISSHLTPVWHLEMLNYSLKPSYEYQEPAWKNYSCIKPQIDKTDEPRKTFKEIVKAVIFSTRLMKKALEKRVKCTILYASETGRSERFAKNLYDIFKYSFDPKILSMDKYDFVNLNHETLLFIVTSTFGNGDPPENGRKFKNFLVQRKKDQESLNTKLENFEILHKFKYSVFALGNKSYPNFCAFGKFLDSSLNDLGAERMYDMGEGDELNGQEESFKEWAREVYGLAATEFCIDTTNLQNSELLEDNLTWSTEKFRLANADKITNTCENLNKLHERKIETFRLLSKKLLTEKYRKTLLIELETDAEEIQYCPGDHIGIFAENRMELVEKILSKASMISAGQYDQPIHVEKFKKTILGDKKWIKDERFPTCSVREAFQFYLDITTPLTQKMLRYLSTQATDQEDKRRLNELSADRKKYEIWKSSWPNLVEVFDEFKSLHPNISLLLTQLPKLQPRFYSISSSTKVCKKTLSLTLGVVKYQRYDKIHFGVCSKWLDEIDENVQVPAFIRKASSFHMPADVCVPIIMVAAGTGIAPYRSFWQERMIQIREANPNTSFGEMILYFGCREQNVDDLFIDEIRKLKDDQVIKNFHIAYSRQTENKVYVQDLIRMNSNEIFQAISQYKGHFYICGEINMAAQVIEALESILVSMGIQDPKEFILKLKEDRRFHEDIFGNNEQHNSISIQNPGA